MIERRSETRQIVIVVTIVIHNCDDACKLQAVITITIYLTVARIEISQPPKIIPLRSRAKKIDDWCIG
jgi:hypothetical protein